MSHLAVYSAIYGSVDVPKVQPDMGCPLVLYTDDPGIEAPGWEVRVEPLPNVASDRMRAKLWKCRPDLAVPEAEVTVWIDGSLTVTRPEMARAMFRSLGNRDALYHRHPWRSCVFAEAEAGRVAPKYADQPTLEQVGHYRDQGHPEGWGLVATGMIVRRNNLANTVLGDDWYHECERWSHQDQLSLPYLLNRRVAYRWGWITDPWEHWWTVSPHET